MVGCRIEVAGQVREIEERAPLMDAEGKLLYQPGDDGVVEPLPPTASEVLKGSPESEFSGYVGLRRGQK